MYSSKNIYFTYILSCGMLAVQEFWGKEKNFTMEKKQNHFSGQLGFVLAAAGSAVGVGNLWRFPYLAAKDGGGLFPKSDFAFFPL